MQEKTCEAARHVLPQAVVRFGYSTETVSDPKGQFARVTETGVECVEFGV